MSQPDYSDFQAEAPSTDDLATLAGLANDLYLAELEVAQAQEALKEAQRKARDIGEHQIPELMDDIGIAEFTTKSGIKLSVKDNLRVSPPAARREEAWDWIEEHGYGDLVKRNVIVGFARDEGDQCEELLEDLDAKGLRTKEERKVESATLKKFIKERLEAGDDVPLDLFGTTQYKQTKITQKPESAFGD